MAAMPEPHNVENRHAHGLQALLLGEVQPDRPEDCHLRTAPHGLGVDEEPVHVKNYCLCIHDPGYTAAHRSRSCMKWRTRILLRCSMERRSHLLERPTLDDQ